MSEANRECYSGKISGIENAYKITESQLVRIRVRKLVTFYVLFVCYTNNYMYKKTEVLLVCLTFPITNIDLKTVGHFKFEKILEQNMD